MPPAATSDASPPRAVTAADRADTGGIAPRITVLGPVGITTPLGHVPISSRRARTLLAALVLAHPHAVDATRLAADVWPDKSPQNPVSALHTQVSRLRRVLGPESIVAGAAGYRLVEPSPVSDLAAAESLSKSRSTPSTDSGANPLLLWTGTPGADLPPGRVREMLTDRAHAAHRLLRERDWRSRLSHDPATVVDEVATARAGAPLDEHLAALHMRACLAADDPNAALLIHAELSRRLGEQLGSDPGPDVAAAHSAALSYTPLPRIPAPPTDAYVGTAQVAKLAAAVEVSPVVTVIGPGGIGKTRLVAEFINTQTSPNVFIDLSGARHPDDITAAVSRALGRGTVPDQGARNAITPSGAGAGVAQLAPASAVVILDACEQLPQVVVEIIAEIRSRRVDLTVIATSRIVLNSADEHTLTVAPLSVSEGTELVTRRARALRSDVLLDSSLLTELCTRLDGSPLALELAAAQLRYLSLADVLARVDTRFSVLSVPGEGRHHTLSGVVAASWDLLPPGARGALEVLSLFPPDVRIEDVLHFDGVSADDLAVLCDHCLATVVDRADGHTRYRITETVRAFASSALSDDASRSAALGRQARAWAVHLVDSLGAQLLRGHVTDVVARLDESADALLSILEDCAGVARSQTPLGPGVVPPDTARLLPVVAWRLVRTGGYPHADQVSHAAVASATGPEHVLGVTCATILFAMSGQFRSAARARAVLRRITADAALSGPLALATAALTRAPAQAARIVAVAARSADPLVAALAEIIRADAAEFVAAPTLSRRCALHALVAAERAGHPWLIATARQRLGRGHILLGDRPGGATHFARSADEFAALGFTEEAAGIRVHQALAIAPSDPATAAELIDACLRSAGDSDRPYIATAHAALAQLRVTTDPVGARHAADRAVEVIGAPHDGHSAYLHAVRAVVLARTGSPVEARVTADALRIAVSWLVAAPTVNLPAIGAAAAAVAMVTGEPGLAAVARGARYRRDFTLIDVGAGPRSHRRDLRVLLR